VAAVADIDDFAVRRLTARSLPLDALREGRPRIGGIGLDVGHDYAIYFLIECLLQDVVPLREHRHGTNAAQTSGTVMDDLAVDG
jgi:hypothetical protein